MKCVVGNQPASSRTPEGPIAPHIGSFEEFLGAQGYAPSSIHRQVLLAACFSRWLKQERVELHCITSDHLSCAAVFGTRIPLRLGLSSYGKY